MVFVVSVFSGVFCDFLEVAFHLILYVREVYPAVVFERRKKYNVPVQVHKLNAPMNSLPQDGVVRERGQASFGNLFSKSSKVPAVADAGFFKGGFHIQDCSKGVPFWFIIIIIIIFVILFDVQGGFCGTHRTTWICHWQRKGFWHQYQSPFWEIIEKSFQKGWEFYP